MAAAKTIDTDCIEFTYPECGPDASGADKDSLS
jgi:hypothetical protein